MPPRSRRTVRGRQELTPMQVYAVVTGFDFFGEWREGHEDRKAAYPRMREAWANGLAEPLTALHIEHFPGTRPWAWWMWDAPARRLRTDGLPHPHDDGSTPAQHRTLYFGMPGSFHCRAHAEAVYECQCAYLARLKLLTHHEQRLMRAPEWQCWEEKGDDMPGGGESLSLEQIRAWMGVSS